MSSRLYYICIGIYLYLFIYLCIIYLILIYIVHIVKILFFLKIIIFLYRDNLQAHKLVNISKQLTTSFMFTNYSKNEKIA
jgi:hypothetical protein